MFQEPIATFIVMTMCCCAIGCQHLTLNGLFGCFPGMTSSLANHRCTLSDVFFYNIIIFDVPQYSHIFHYINDIRPAIYFDNQKSLHIIFKTSYFS